MALTNKLGLPEALVRAIENLRAAHTPSGADATVTELVGSPRIGALRRAHKHEVVEDVADNIWSLWGQMVHKILEEAGRDLPDTLTEKMLWTEVRGWRVCGVLDTHSLIDGRLSDWKVSSWYGFKDGPKAEHEAQLNLLAMLLEDLGHPVKELELVPLIRDHMAVNVKRYVKEGYPPEPVCRIPVERWSESTTRDYLVDRVRRHQEARIALQQAPDALAGDYGFPHCTREERWQRDEKWAVMKGTNIRATSLCNSQSEALAVIGDAPNFRVEYRPGLAKKCPKCSVRPWCEQLSDGQFSPGDLEETADA